MSTTNALKHRKACLYITLAILGIWFLVSLGCSILFREWMDFNMPKVGNAPFGFWMAQQGSIICFVLLLVAYAIVMYRLDSKYGYLDSQHESSDAVDSIE